MMSIKPMNIRTFSLTLAALLAVTLMVGTYAQEAKSPKLYKWVDKNGVVHYGSSVPPEYANQQLEVLNSEGITVKTVAAPKTAEEIAKENQDKAAAAAKAKQDREQRANDQMLLDTYTSTADIERDRISRLSAIDSQIKVINGSISGLTSILADYQKQEVRLTQAHKPLPASLTKNLKDTQDQLTLDNQLLLKQQQEKQAIQDRYAEYLKRFKELTESSPANGGS
jgi:hypothetical protein